MEFNLSRFGVFMYPLNALWVVPILFQCDDSCGPCESMSGHQGIPHLYNLLIKYYIARFCIKKVVLKKPFPDNAAAQH